VAFIKFFFENFFEILILILNKNSINITLLCNKNTSLSTFADCMYVGCTTVCQVYLWQASAIRTHF